MGIATFPAGSSGLSSVVRSLQRGEAVSAGNITISSVDTTKTIVNSFGTSSTGTVAATGTISAATGATSGASGTGSAQSGNVNTFVQSYPAQGILNQNSGRYSGAISFGSNMNAQNLNLNAQNINLNTTSLSGGSNNLISASYGAYLAGSTTLTVTGPCRYEVIEYF